MPFNLLKIDSLYEKISSVEQGEKESKIKDILNVIITMQSYDWVLHKADSKTG